MSAKLDQSLDSIIQTDNTSRPRRGGRGNFGRGGAPRSGGNHPLSRAGNGNNNNNNNFGNGGAIRRDNRDRAENRATPYASNAGGSTVLSKKIVGDSVHISNLARDVDEDDVREIFKSIGAISRVTVNYNREGQSLGTAELRFENPRDAQRAVSEFDGAEVDGRPMYIKIVGNIQAERQVVQRAPQQNQNFQQRGPREVVQNRNFNQQNQGNRGGNNRQQNFGNRGQNGGNGGNGGNRRGGMGGNRQQQQQRKPASAEDLDSEMDSYFKTKSSDETSADASDNQTAAAE